MKIILSIFLTLNFINFYTVIAIGIPETEKEIYQTEIPTQPPSRQPIEEDKMSATEKAVLREKLAQSKYPPQVNPNVREIIYNLQLLKVLRTINPFK